MAEALPNPLPVGDPARTALYNSELAALEHQLHNAETNATAGRGEAEVNYKLGLSNLAPAERNALSAEEGKANTGGILESGINARERGRVQSGYTQKRTGLGITEQRNLDKIARGEAAARENYGTRLGASNVRAEENYKREQEALAPNEFAQPATAAPPAPPRGPGTHVVSSRPQSRTVRQKAGRRAIGGSGGTRAPG